MLFWNVSKYGNIYKTVFVIFCYRKYLIHIFSSLRNIIMSDTDNNNNDNNDNNDNNIRLIKRENAKAGLDYNIYCFYMDEDDSENDIIMSDICTDTESEREEDSDTSLYDFMRDVNSTAPTIENSPVKRKTVTFNNKLFVVWIPERCEYDSTLRKELWYTAFDYRIFSQTYQMERQLERQAMQMYA